MVMMTSPGLAGAAMLLLASGVLLHKADKEMTSVLKRSLALRRSLQVDPAATMASACGGQATPRVHLGGIALRVGPEGTPSPLDFACNAVIRHRKGTRGHKENREAIPGETFWQTAACGTPAGRAVRLEPVRFRQIRVCCQRGERPCLLEWRFFMKS